MALLRFAIAAFILVLCAAFVSQAQAPDAKAEALVPVTGWARYGIIPMPLHGVLRKHDESVPKVSGTLGIVWDIFSPEYLE
jgi:hypothetical protein